MTERAIPVTVLVSCEHASRAVPRGLGGMIPRSVLASHRGFDRGARDLARYLGTRMHAPVFNGAVSRLVIDLNRSLGNRSVFSSYTRNLDRLSRDRLIDRYYRPYRAAVRRAVAGRIARGAPVLHVAVHTFTPVRRGVRRDVDVAWLFDPGRVGERDWARAWRAACGERESRLRLGFNRPYRGTADGLTTWLRREFPARFYCGLELEINQRLVSGPAARWRRIRQLLADGFQTCLVARIEG